MTDENELLKRCSYIINTVSIRENNSVDLMIKLEKVVSMAFNKIINIRGIVGSRIFRKLCDDIIESNYTVSKEYVINSIIDNKHFGEFSNIIGELIAEVMGLV